MSDFLLLTAQPCETINREPEADAVKKIAELCKNNNVEKNSRRSAKKHERHYWRTGKGLRKFLKSVKNKYAPMRNYF